MTKEKLIKQCKEQLKWTYVDKLTSLHESDGEVYLSFDDYMPDQHNDYIKLERVLVFNAHQLYPDLASIIDLVIKANCKNQKRLKEELQNLLKSNEPKTKKKRRAKI